MPHQPARNIISLAFFLTSVLGGGIAIGILTAPGDWYANLIKPSFNPPNWVFGPVWTVLYIFIGVAGWRAWLRPAPGKAMKVWRAQLLLNFIWSPAFFVMHRMDIALAIISLLFAAIIAFILMSWREDKLAAALFLPYAIWVGFALILNATLVYLNGPTGV